MRRHIEWMSVLAMASSIACSSPAEQTQTVAEASRMEATAKTITILHVNDTHSHLEAEGPKDQNLDGTLGGIVRAASIIYPLKASDPSVLFVHAGDVFQEDVYFGTTAGVAELQLLSQGLHLDAMTLGNHEFNLTPATLVAALSAAYPDGDSPVVTANLDYDNSSLAGLASLVRKNTMKDVNGVKVGLFGLVTADPAEQFPAPASDPPAVNVDYVGIAQKQVDLLRRKHADVVVLLSHLGFDQDKRIATAVSGLDAIVGGHDHLLKSEIVTSPRGKPVPVVHAGEFYKWVGKLTLKVEKGQVSVVDQEFIPVDATVERFAPFAQVVERLQQQANATYREDLFHTAIAYAASDIAQYPDDSDPNRDSAVADLITDALLARGQALRGRCDIALTSNGFLTEGLTRGPLVAEDAFRIVGDGFDPGDPFGPRLGFPLYWLELRGDLLQQAIGIALSLGGDYFPQVSGMSITFNPSGDRLDVLVQGKAIDPQQVYSATVNLGLLQGLEQMVGPLNAEPLGVTEYEAVRDWLVESKNAQVVTGRIQVVP